MVTLGFDTATAATAVAVLVEPAAPIELWHQPEPGQRPGHAQQLLALAREALARAELGFADVERIGVGVGPGTFTGLRIGVATARALAQGGGAELVAVSTLEALAEAAYPHAADGGVLAVLDARRGEAFVAAYRAGVCLHEPSAVAPERLGAVVADLPGPWLAVGDGAIRFRGELAAAHVVVADDDAELHRVSAAAICRLARSAAPIDRDALVPHYVREPDAVPRRAEAR